MSLNRNFITDMQLLGHGLNTSLLQELPTLPNDAWILDNDERGRKLVFDGLAYGQYLFGQDPLHQGGIRTSGHQNEHFRTKIENFRWSLRPHQNSIFTIGYEWGQSRIEIANVHVHSKEIVEGPSTSSLRWLRVMDEAMDCVSEQSLDRSLTLFTLKESDSPPSCDSREKVER